MHTYFLLPIFLYHRATRRHGPHHRRNLHLHLHRGHHSDHHLSPWIVRRTCFGGLTAHDYSPSLRCSLCPCHRRHSAFPRFPSSRRLACHHGLQFPQHLPVRHYPSSRRFACHHGLQFPRHLPVRHDPSFPVGCRYLQAVLKYFLHLDRSCLDRPPGISQLRRRFPGYTSAQFPDPVGNSTPVAGVMLPLPLAGLTSPLILSCVFCG